MVTHPPLYRELSFVNPAGGFDTLTASWEFGISSNVAQTPVHRRQGGRRPGDLRDDLAGSHGDRRGAVPTAPAARRSSRWCSS